MGSRRQLLCLYSSENMPVAVQETLTRILLQPMMMENMIKTVDEVYSERARTGSDPSYSVNVASAVGYTQDQLSSVPDGANLGLGCGNPVAIAALQQGEVVLDLGSGGGFDVFLASNQVGPTGVAIGLDGSQDMIDLARRNAETRGVKPPHVAFVRASLTSELPIESSSIDCVLSNCVLNLIPGNAKADLLKEVYRVLKPGGRIRLSDIVANQDIPTEIRNNPGLYVNGVAGAIPVGEYENHLLGAGFSDISFVNTHNDLGIYDLSSPPQQGGPCRSGNKASSGVTGTTLPLSPNPNDFAASYEITALKPSTPSTVISPIVLKNWHDAYPPTKSSPETVTFEEIAALIRDPKKTNKDFIVIDVRRNDHAGGHVRGSFQCPAQSFYDDAQSYYEKFKDSKQVIFYCQSSNGRGPRCAAWYQDYLDSVGHSSSKAYVLAGGVKEWVAKYKGQDDLVDYD